MIKMYGLETTNRNGKLYTLATLRIKQFKAGPPTELLKNLKKTLGNAHLLKNVIVGTTLGWKEL